MFSVRLRCVGLPVWQIDSAWAALVQPASRLENEPRRGRLATGIGALDAQLGGGWPAGSLSEIAGRRSAGRTSVLYASLAAAIDRGQAVALVDSAGVLDPRSAEAAGVVLARLLWIRAAGRAVLQAADLLVAAGGFGLVAVDFGERPRRVPDAAWLRLRHAAERQGTAVLITTPWRIVGAVAAAAVVMHAAKPDFVDASCPLLVALETRATVERIVGISPPPANEQVMCFRADRFQPPRLPRQP
jgi:recA bacterial DNA recombination protein